MSTTVPGGLYKDAKGNYKNAKGEAVTDAEAKKLLKEIDAEAEGDKKAKK